MGHHLIASGALCLNVGAEVLGETINLGAVGLLVPSLGLLSQGDEPLLLVTRPTAAIDFTIGEGTEDSPNLTAHLRNLEVDLYAFILERFIRVFSVRLSTDLGINIEFATSEEGVATLMPVLSGLEADKI